MQVVNLFMSYSALNTAVVGLLDLDVLIVLSKFMIRKNPYTLWSCISLFTLLESKSRVRGKTQLLCISFELLKCRHNLEIWFNSQSFSSNQAKLDGYRADFQRGKELNEDQKLAISKYEEVLQNLDFARELSGQVNVV